MLRKNTASQVLCFAGINATTGAALTGATFSYRRCIDGTFAAGGGTITEDTGTGFYKVALAQADTNGNDLAFFFTATNAIPVCINALTTAADPSDTVRFGLTALPNVASGSAGAVITSGTGTAQLSVAAGLVTPTVAAVADIADSVWNEAIVDHLTAGSTGAQLNAAGAAGDPWSTALPGAYGAGTAGKLVGDNINATISSRSTLDAAGVRTAVGLASANLDTQLSTIDTVVDSILVDTAEIGVAGAGLTALGSAANLATVDTVVDAIKAKTDSLTFTVAGNVDANIQRINDVTITGNGQVGTEFGV